MLPKILNCLNDSPFALEVLWELCEFSPADEQPPDWVTLESKELLQVVGRDASGGCFCLFPSTDDFSGQLLFIDSEGSAGVIASSLTEGIRMMITLPYWRDCLKFSGGGKVEEMIKARSFAEEKLFQDYPDIETKRRLLFSICGLRELDAPAEALHRAVTLGASIKLLSTKDAWPLEPLFNSFVPEQCLSWKRGTTGVPG